MKVKQLLATGLIVGMVAITGCAHNLPETNQGNRNGQRVADAVNHRPDSYTTTSHRLPQTENKDMVTRGTTNRATRQGFSRAEGSAKTQNARRNTTEHRTILPTTNPTRRVNPPTTTAPVTPNRSLNLGRPQGRIGSDFRTNHNNVNAYSLDTEATTRSTVNNNVATPSPTVAPTVAPKATVNETAPKKIDTVRSTTPKTTAPKTATPKVAVPHVVTPAPAVPAPTAAPVAPVRTVRSEVPVSRGHRNPRLEEQVKQMHEGRTNINTHAINETGYNNTTNNIDRVNRSSHSARRNRARANRNEENRNNRNVNTVNENTATRNTTNRTNTTNHAVNPTTSNKAVNFSSRNHAGVDTYSNRLGGRVELLDQTVQVVNNEDYGFFRKKVEEPAPVAPTPENSPEVPTRTRSTSYYDHDIDQNNNQNTDADNNTPNNNNNTTPIPNQNAPTRTAPLQRVMK